MKYYPINLDVRGKKIVVVGGGTVAQQKLIALLQAEACVTVVSPRFHPELVRLSREEKISLVQKEYQKGDLEEAFLVFGATNHPEINRQIHEEAKERNILFNAVDQPDECDFIIPAKVVRGDLLIAISTAGSAPFLSKKIREKLELAFGAEYEPFLKLFRKLRLILIEEKKKDQLIPFFDQYEEALLNAMKEEDRVLVRKILEKYFGEKISQLLMDKK